MYDYPLDPLDAIAHQQHLQRLADIRRGQVEAMYQDIELDAAIDAAMTYAPIKHHTPQQAQASAALDALCRQAEARGTMDAYGL